MGLRYKTSFYCHCVSNPKLSIWKLKMVPHWNVSTKSIVNSRWFFVDRQFRIRILTFMGCVSVYVQSINCLTRWTTHLWTPVDTFSKKRKPDQTVNLQRFETCGFQQRLTFSKIAKGLPQFRGTLKKGCFAENHFRPHRVDQVFFINNQIVQSECKQCIA